MIVYGHRGARGEAPENTIAGARHAVARGVRHLEIDLRISADDELVIVHDSTLKRTTGMQGLVASTSAAGLARLDARADGPPWPDNVDTGIPTLTAMYEAVPEVEHWQLEMKHLGTGANRRMVAALVEWLQRHQPNAVVTSDRAELLAAVKAALPGQRVGLVAKKLSQRQRARAREPVYEYLVAKWNTLESRRQVRHYQDSGTHVSAWTVNDASEIERLFQLGVDSVITDYPSMALPLVARLQR